MHPWSCRWCHSNLPQLGKPPWCIHISLFIHLVVTKSLAVVSSTTESEKMCAGVCMARWLSFFGCVGQEWYHMVVLYLVVLKNHMLAKIIKKKTWVCSVGVYRFSCVGRTCMWMHVWRSEVDVKCLPLLFSTLFNLSRGLSLNLKLTDWASEL